jgi:hypothetical protein
MEKSNGAVSTIRWIRNGEKTSILHFSAAFMVAAC